MLTKNLRHNYIDIDTNTLTSFISDNIIDIVVCMNDFTKFTLISTDNDDSCLCVICVFTADVLYF